MTTKVLLRSAVLLLLLFATFTTSAVTQDDDLGFDLNVETPLIERHRQSSIFHRIKRSFWNLFDGGDTESTTTETPEAPAVPDEPQTEQDKKPLPLTAEDDTGGQQTDYDENAAAGQQTDYDENAAAGQQTDYDENVVPGEQTVVEEVVPTSSQERKIRESGEDPDAYTNDINRVGSDDEDEYGSGEVEGSADTGFNFDSDLKPGQDFHVDEPVPAPGLESRPGPESPTHFYRVTIIISEPYRQNLADRDSVEFKDLSGQLSEAIDGLYQNALPDQRTRSKILKFVQTSDPVAIQVSLDVESTSPDESRIRSIFVEQLQLHTLGNVQARPDGFSLKNVQDLNSEECESETRFRCQSDGECIPISAKCDGNIQCIDESDEADCSPPETTTIVGVPRGCEIGEFACDVNRCIGNDQRCDFVKQCDDESDELDCPKPPDCGPEEFKCKNGQCIHEDLVCDETSNCYDNSDEINCHEIICNPDSEWTCRNGRCIEKSLKCNGLDDCGDRSDEQTCPCTESQFKCDNGFCIPKYLRCDSFNHCQDKSDERDCDESTSICRNREFQCTTGECIENKLYCDGKQDCADNSDEHDCPVKVCSGDQFRCNDGTCLSGSARCNQVRECPSGEDEHQCGCGISEFRCMDGSCIPDNLMCDRSDDCPDGSDEGCDPCKLKSPTLTNLIRCRLRLNSPLCEPVISAIPPLRSFGDLNSSCEKIIHTHVIRNNSAWADGNEFSNTETSSISSTEGRDVNSYENKIDPNTEVEIIESASKSRDSDRSPEVELINSNEASVETEINTGVGPDIIESVDNSWEYFPKLSKGRFKNRPKQRPMEKKLYDQGVKRCQINCLKAWARKKHRTEFDNSLEMKVEMNRNWKTIYCLERAGNRSSEEKCFDVDMVLRSRQLAPLRRSNREDHSKSEKITRRNGKPRRRQTRGTRMYYHDYFKKYGILKKFTPESIKATTAASSDVSYVTKKSNPNSGNFRSHEAIRERAKLEVLYYDKCGFDCEEYFIRLYDGKSSEISRERKSDVRKRTTTEEPTEGTTTEDYSKCGFKCEEYFRRLYDEKSNEISRERKSEVGKRTTTEKPKEGTTTEEVTEANERQTVTEKKSIFDWDFGFGLGTADDSKSVEVESIEASSSRPETTTELWYNRKSSVRGDRITYLAEYPRIEQTNEIEHSVESPKESSTRRKHKSKKDRKRDKKIRKNSRKRTTSTETTIQYSTTEKFDKERCSDDEFHCDDENCIKKYRVCDGHVDCEDRADENDCGDRTNLSNNSDHDMENEIIDWEIDNEVLRTTYSRNLQLTTEIITTSKPNGRQTTTDSNSIWGFDLPDIFGGDDSSKSAERKSTKASFGHREMTTQKSWKDYDWFFGGKSNSVESENFGKGMSNKNSVEITRDSSFERDNKDKSNRKENKNEREGGHEKTTETHEDQTVTEKKSIFDWDFGFGSGITDDSKSVEVKSIETSSNRPEITRQKSSWDSKSSHFRTGDPKPLENESSSSPSSKQTITTNEKTTETSTTDEIEEESCPGDQHYCDNGKCVEYELTCDGAYDCEDGSDERECDYYNKELKYFEYDEDSDGSHWKNDDTELGTTRKNDLRSTVNVDTTTETYKHQTVTEKKSISDWDFGFWSETADDSKSVKVESIESSSSRPEITTQKSSWDKHQTVTEKKSIPDWDFGFWSETDDDSKSVEVESIESSSSRPEITRQKWSWDSKSSDSRTGDPKSSENESSTSPSSKQTTTTEEYNWDIPSWPFWGDDSKQSKSGEQNSPLRETSGSMSKGSEEQVKNDDEDSELIDIPDYISTTTDDSTTRDENRLTKSAYDVTTSYPKSRVYNYTNIWTNFVTKHDSVTESVTSTIEPLKQNYNAYNIPFTRPENPRKWYGQGRDRQERRRQYYERLRQEQIRNQHQREEQRRMKEEQDQDRRRDEYERRIWELNRKNQEIKEEERRLRIQKLAEIAARRRSKITGSPNDWRRWPSRTDCFGRSHRCQGPGRLTQACPAGKWPCSNGVCIDQDFRCDDHLDCLDGSDEANCQELTTPQPQPQPSCRRDEFQCSDGHCIPGLARCDGISDCRDSGDEIGCPQGCGQGEFECRNRNCVRQEDQCNQYDDCGDNSDEENCVPTQPLGPGAERLDLKTYPTEQIIKESREVVIQCRDEGMLRARVHWIREDGAPLPPGSTDINGRLEMPNVQIIHSGNYVCEALGVSTNTPGRRVISHLTVEKETPPTLGPPRSCEFDEATCSNGDCIAKSRVCDGRYDCTDGTDEIRCSEQGCEPNQFRCVNKECVSKVWRCDGDKDCVDGSDEQNCEPAPPGSACQYNEYQCADRQCIPKTFQCDKERDCFDGSDEFGCSEPQILRPPQHMVILNVGDTFTITCTAFGIPHPEISWRLNWGHVPSKCTMTSINGTGVLTCPSVTIEDQGAYSCEAMNSKGWKIAVPDAILKVDSKSPDVCPRGTFNSLAKTADECISCFCFGVATQCASADLFTYQLPAPFDQFKVVSVETYSEIKILGEVAGNGPDVRPLGRNGVQVSERYGDTGNPSGVLYFALPESYHNSQLKSYGGYLKYTVRHGGRGRPNDAPSVILTGNNYVLIHKGESISSDYETEKSVRFFFGDWVKKQGWDEVIASREEIMMALAHVDNILIKVKYDDGPIDTTITNVFMDTADVRNTDQGAATFVEECRCPVGYSGLSCEHCESGYLRRDSGPWLGQCYREEPACQPGYYKDPSRNIPCQPCPCPLTDPSNQYSRTCHLGADGQPTCDCPQGYLGRRCEQCAPGYQGNPLRPGDSCVKVDECDPNGSISPYADPATGVCRCKALSTGRTCNKCKANTFHLAATNKFGCVSCFCMGVTSKCTSSNWYRSEIYVAFTSSVRDFSLVESKSTDPSPIVDGIRLNKIDREIVYDAFPNRETNDVYYWQLPSNFLGDQLASYGGNLKYTVRYVPSPGGARSRNNAADVELISSNDIILRHYSGKQLEPNTAETFTVQLLEDYWQRNDGTIADREHLLMALADVQAIRIKATYTTHTDEAALSSISLDTAVNSNTGKARAVEVEQCSCPAGYRGLSCEDCDVGYTRGDDGLYLGSCVPCNCNGHSTQCDPETGACENCRDYTTGDNCESCIYGYEGDATRGSQQDCQPGVGPTRPPPCLCDPAGSRGTDCYAGQCECKTNVEGPECNRCRQSTFGLSVNNIDGCVECYCSGVTKQCHESSLFIDQIPTVIYDSSHGFTLTDSNRRDVITEGFDLNTATNEIGYRYPDSRDQRLFWSLPSEITGNQVKSYGGNLRVTQHISTRSGAKSQKDQDVLLIGNGITLYWTNSEDIQPGIPLTYNVPLVESAWTRLTQEEGLRSASRADLMTVLSNLEAILVRATHSSKMTATYISDVSLDTAVEQLANNKRATQVEACRCPSGYTGTSCEICATGHYRDVTDTSRSFLGACNICPCNGNEQECKVDRLGGVKCYCLPGFSGLDCSVPESSTTEVVVTDLPPPRIFVTISGDLGQIVQIGSSVTYNCAGQSEDSRTISIEWQKESGQLPPGRSYDDTQGILIIRDLKVTDSGIYVCQVSDGINIVVKKVTLLVGGERPSKPLRPVIEPRYLTVQEGNPVEFKCKSSGNPPPQLSWVRVQGEINPDAVFENGIWSLASVRKSDQDQYKCIAQNSAGTSEFGTILYVTERTQPPPEPSAPIINPSEWNDAPGIPVNLACTAPQGARITWTRSDNAPLPVSANEQNGILTIYDPAPSDSGYYICTAISYDGIETRSTARITIQSSPRGPPSVSVEPARQEVSQGTLVEVKCIVTGDPTPVVTWTKHGEPLADHIQVVGNNLRIINPRVSDRGVYVCHASNSGGDAQGSALIDVNRREMPIIELYPQPHQVVHIDGSALLQCRATAGLPTPSVSWTREDGRLFSSNVEQLPGGILRFNRVTLEDGGSFVCTAVNEVGTVSLIATIEISTPPMITMTPSNRSPLTVRLGERVKLSCTASGQPQPSVTWSKHRSGGVFYAAVPESRSSTAVYEISSVSYDDEGTYTCLATNDYGPVEERIQIRVENSWSESDTSTPSPNTNGSNVGVTIPEESLRIPDGGKVEMRCQVHASDQEAIYLDWKRNDGRNLPQRSTVRDGILLIPAVTKDDAGAYICQGLNSNGNILFTATSYLEIISPPRIELEPIRQTVRRGESPSVVCRVTGDEPIDIEWQAIDRPLPYTVSQRGGFLQFNGITSADAGKYVCKATNNAGTAEAIAEVFIDEYHQPPLPANQPDIRTFVGNSVRLDCPADSRSVIVWSKHGGDIPRNSNRNGNSLELTEVKVEDGGRYICRITTENGASSSNSVELTVQLYGELCDSHEFQCHSAECIDRLYLCDGYIDCTDESDEQYCFNRYYRHYPQRKRAQSVPAVTVRIQASQDLVNIGDSIDVQCDASGARDARYRWTRVNELSLPQNAQDYGTVLRLTNVAMVDSGIYRCTADTREGSFKKDYELIVQGGNNDAPAVETKLAPYGSGVVMDCRADIEPPIRYQWQKLGGRLPVNSRTSENRIELMDVKAKDAGTYICEASNGRVNIEMPQVLVVTGVVPNFNQAPESYISFAPIPDATFQFQIEVSFKPEKYDGIILYNGQFSDGTGDFILLSLVGGYPEFRFDLGSSPAVIRGHRPITLGRWHTIKLLRDVKRGTMLVDGEGPYTGLAGGRFQTLDLSEPLFIGGVPDYNATSRQVNVKSGFVGCISKLVIGDNQLDLTDDLLSSVGVTTCETCAENPCSNSGVCQEAATENGYTCLCPAGYSGKNCTKIGQACYPDVCGEGTCIDRDDGFVCSCPIGKGGSRCEFDVNVVEPGFHDRSAYLAYQTPKVFRKQDKRYRPKKTGSISRPRISSFRKDRPRNHPNHHAMHHTKQ